jgi:hypothetical protein
LPQGAIFKPYVDQAKAEEDEKDNREGGEDVADCGRAGFLKDMCGFGADQDERFPAPVKSLDHGAIKE